MHEKLQDLLKLTGDQKFPDSSELHGVLCAHALKKQAPDKAAGDELARWLDLQDQQTEVLIAALNEEHQALLAGDLSYQLYLPTDSAELSLRTQALAAWCGGFVSGIGVHEDWLPEAPQIVSGVASSGDVEVREAIADLSQIARADLETQSGNQEEEQAFAEIVEYVRVAVLLIHSSLNESTASQQQPILH